jgi:glycosyltransferase involved in cell wall biosynthesis
MPRGVLKIVTVYDLVWLLFPETMSLYNLYLHRAIAEKAIQRADLVIVISRSTGEDLVRLLGVPSGKVKLVYPGISESYMPQESLPAAEYISAKYRVPPCYMAAVGTIEPRKNLKLLVEVLRILKANAQLKCPLLVAGAKGWKNSHLFRGIQAAGLTEKEIRFLGYLPDEDLPFFYGGAQLFLFPSMYEGFGLPPLEAMACGTPVIASNARPMPEILGDAAILEPPASAQRFSTAIERVLADANLRYAMRNKGIARAQMFRPETSVRQLLRVFSGK